MQARLSATGEGAPPSLAADGTAAALAASLSAAALASLSSAFTAVSASRTSLLPTSRSGCCSRSLASSGLGPRSGSAKCSPRTASRRGVLGSHMRPPLGDPHEKHQTSKRSSESRRRLATLLACLYGPTPSLPPPLLAAETRPKEGPLLSSAPGDAARRGGVKEADASYRRAAGSGAVATGDSRGEAGALRRRGEAGRGEAARPEGVGRPTARPAAPPALYRRSLAGDGAAPTSPRPARSACGSGAVAVSRW
eukprot:scaffold90127_cov63-Phaeocystis_antarctica.AAC.2